MTVHQIPNTLDLEAFWMPFTANRQFKETPRLIASAEGMYYTGIDGAKRIEIDPENTTGYLSLACVGLAYETELPLPERFAFIARALEIELKISAEKAIRLQTAEQEVGIGHGGQRAAAVADGARIGARG